MQIIVKLLLLIDSVALVSFFLAIENIKRAYVASMEGTGKMINISPPSPLSLWCLALGGAGICVLFWALCKDLRVRRRKADVTLSTVKCRRIRSRQISTNEFVNWHYLISSISLICLFFEVEPDRPVDPRILADKEMMIAHDFLNMVALICLVLGFVGTAFSIGTAWAKWARKRDA